MEVTIRNYASEKSEHIDPETELLKIRWTSSQALDRPLYFTSHSVTLDDRWLVFLSERNGHPNFYRICRSSGEITNLSDNSNGPLVSYCYPVGTNLGLGKSSPCLDTKNNILYYLQGDIIYRVCLNSGTSNVLSQLPKGWFTAFTHLSADGRILCVPCAEPAAFQDNMKTQWDQLDVVPRRFREHELITRLYFIDTSSGKSWVHAEVPFWVTHVNFMPDNTRRLIVNSEGNLSAKEGKPPRIWCVEEDGSARPLFQQDGNANHENCTRTENWIVYHGAEGVVDNRSRFVAARDWSGELVFKHDLGDIPMMHATTMQDPYCSLVDSKTDITIISPDTHGGVQTRLLCRHMAREGYSRNQDLHVHPLQTPDGQGVVFCSNQFGEGDVFEIRSKCPELAAIGML